MRLAIETRRLSFLPEITDSLVPYFLNKHGPERVRLSFVPRRYGWF
jgi:hypothetical protein